MAMSDAEVMARIAPAPRTVSYGGRIKPGFAHLHAELKHPNMTLMLLWQEYSAANAGGLTDRYFQVAALYRQYVATLRRSIRRVHRAGGKLVERKRKSKSAGTARELAIHNAPFKGHYFLNGKVLKIRNSIPGAIQKKMRSLTTGKILAPSHEAYTFQTPKVQAP
jgi:hypothetical protein